MQVNRRILYTPALATGVPAGITLSPGSGGVVAVSSQPASFSITGLNGGTNFPAGSVVVVAFFNHDAGGTITTPLIGGQSASLIVNDTSHLFLSVYSVLVGGSSISDTFGGANGNFFTDMVVRAWILQGATSATPTSVLTGNGTAGPDPQVPTGAPTTVATGGVGLAAYGATGFTAGTTTLWGNPSGSISPDGFARVNGSYLFSTSNTTTPGSWSPGITGSSSLAFLNTGMFAATFL